MAKVYHVSKQGNNKYLGTAEAPFLTINHAAQLAMPGDEVIVHEGCYRESVNPKFGGISDKRRITYRVADGEKVVIKGSEEIKGWKNKEGSIWYVEIPNSFFGEFNPYKEKIWGDWLIYRYNICHRGDVYLNGMSFYEVETYEELLKPEVRTEILDHWTETIVPIVNPERTKYVWYTNGDEEVTRIYANFHDANPNEELVEINVRKNVFFPSRNGRNYITVRGFEMCHAATQWAPPTAEQEGLIGPNWSKGWIIEDNKIHDSKCSAVALGKEYRSGDNYKSIRADKPGFIYQLESVFTARNQGWDKETIGSHIVRNNEIYDCGENAVVGHLGSAFCEIYNNHIYRIAIKREFYGHEIAGIKLHAAVDTYIHDNHIHDCSLGIWLDWQAQGTRVSRNLFYDNSRDLFIEVTHGPHIVDNNVSLSDYFLDNHAQGGAYINNIVAGKMVHKKILDRMTPYHEPHSTHVKGYIAVYGGDDRYMQNIYLNGYKVEGCGTNHFDGYPSSFEEYMKLVNPSGQGDHEQFNETEQPVYISGNHYYNGATSYEKESDSFIKSDFNTEFKLEKTIDGVYLNVTLPEDFASTKAKVITTYDLERTRVSDTEFDVADGSDLIVDRDYFGERYSDSPIAGAIQSLKAGSNRIKLA